MCPACPVCCALTVAARCSFRLNDDGAVRFEAYSPTTSQKCVLDITSSQVRRLCQSRIQLLQHDREAERVEFLYKLTPGVAHRSFGLNVARMAGLPASVLRAAGAKASALERADAAKRARKEASERRRRRGAEEEAGGDDDEAFARSLDVVKSATRKALDAVAEAAARFREDPGGGGAMEALEKRRAEIEREAMTTT